MMCFFPSDFHMLPRKTLPDTENDYFVLDESLLEKVYYDNNNELIVRVGGIYMQICKSKYIFHYDDPERFFYSVLEDYHPIKEIVERLAEEDGVFLGPWEFLSRKQVNLQHGCYKALLSLPEDKYCNLLLPQQMKTNLEKMEEIQRTRLIHSRTYNTPQIELSDQLDGCVIC
ncbi:ORF172 [White spot syndrome virus]|uniref:ORF172 n=1 Tax=White spot syndrome virus TaxID=342409 RepID=Q91L81_9VIRU|nr:ORF172 [White spot syndrome virus]